MKRWMTSAALILFIVIFGLYIRGARGTIFDLALIRFIQNLISVNWRWPYFITSIGNVTSYFAIYPVVLAYCVIKKDYRLFFTLLLATLFSNLLVEVFKHIFIRIRPMDFMRITQGGYSFPSGHASVSSATLWTLYRIVKGDSNTSKRIRMVSLILPLIIGLTRLILGVHWPTDVIFGFMLGFSVANIAPELHDKIGTKLERSRL